MPITPSDIQLVTIAVELAPGIILSFKKAFADVKGKTVDELLASASGDWDKAQKDLDALAQEGHSPAATNTPTTP